jgi:hypothetical protein
MDVIEQTEIERWKSLRSTLIATPMDSLDDMDSCYMLAVDIRL